MFRTVAAVVAGNFIWTALWLGLNALLRMQGLLPAEPTQRVDAPAPLGVMLIASVVFSIAVGWITTAIAGGNTYWAAIILAVIQLALGIFFQTQSWHLMPIWYHLPFLLLLVPATLLGAWLRLR